MQLVRLVPQSAEYGSSRQDLVCADQPVRSVCVCKTCDSFILKVGKEQKILLKIGVHINILRKILGVQLPLSAAWMATITKVIKCLVVTQRF